ncbi:sodium-dependent nutrient amino acid transporter 1-like isoform X2 [Ornithodoros turicata]
MSTQASVKPPSGRGQWGRGLEFFLSCASMSVGLGNVWRFPNVAYANGGGAFLVPYLILLLLIGRPLYYMEIALGQFSGLGTVKVWKAVPAMRGLGYAQLFSVAYTLIFYNFLVALAVRYFLASMSSTLPWTECQDSWFQGTQPPLSCDSFNIFGATSYNASLSNATESPYNDTLFSDMSNVTDHRKRISVPELYWKYHITHQSEGLWDIQWMSWELSLCLFFVWAFMALSLLKGVKTIGKVAYFTAIFPYVVLISLLVVACLQEGAFEGIKRFFTPEWHKLYDIQVWYKACEQSFFSLTIGYGALIVYSSYNDFRNNVYRDAIMLSVLDTFTSILAGCVVFAVLGSLSTKLGVDFENVVGSGGTDLAYIVYPEALANIEFVPQLWSVLFFLMLFTLGVGSSVALVETILTTIRDQFPQLQKRKWMLVLPCTTFLFLCGLSLTTDAGQYIMRLLDNYGVGGALFFYAILESVSIMWIYGYRSFCKDIEFMLNMRVGIFWKVTWAFMAPILLIGIFVYGNILLFMDGGGSGKGIPWWGNLIGWMLAAVCLIQIPVWMVVVVRKTKGSSLLERLRQSFRPAMDWGPRDLETRHQWKIMKDGLEDKGMAPPPYAVAVLPLSNGLSNPAFEMTERTSL